jgi:UDP-glucose 4-epimerase
LEVLVTGGAGYIGSIVAAQLITAGHRVVVYDNLSKGSEEAVPQGAVLVVGDVGDGATLEQLFRDHRFDAVMQLAAFIEAGESMLAPERYFRNNAANALTLLESVLKHRVPRFVFSSTAAVYGDPERIPVDEGDALRPTNAYGASKLLVEQMLTWFHCVHGLRCASLRYFNAAGATEEHGEDHNPETHLIPIALDVAQGQRLSVSIFGTDYPTPDVTCIRDYIHVSDLAAAHLLALDRLGKDELPEQLIYNLGNGLGFSVREVIEAARRVTGRAIKTVEVTRRSGDPAVLVASSQRIQRELGWSPKYQDLDAIVESAWRWRLAHPRGYRCAIARKRPKS